MARKKKEPELVPMPGVAEWCDNIDRIRAYCDEHPDFKPVDILVHRDKYEETDFTEEEMEILQLSLENIPGLKNYF